MPFVVPRKSATNACPAFARRCVRTAWSAVSSQRASMMPGHAASSVASIPQLVRGADSAIADLRRILADHRLVTLVGAGGVGKTRLAVRVTEDLVRAYSDGASFVDLAPLVDTELLPYALLVALGAPGPQEGDPREAVIEYLRQREMLVVLDNCEHLVSACANLLDVLLRASPHVRVLATSREPLGVEGEVTWRVPSLASPDQNTPTSVAGLATYEAVQLFVERARLVQPGFELTNDNAAAVAEVCRRLDGIPLALELAAARLRVLPIEQIARRLDDDLRLLVGGSRTAPPRHQTLRATLDWSYGLLDSAERILFRRLAVFAGRFTLDAVEAVCSGTGVDRADALEVLTGLVDRSLTLCDLQPDEARYRLLEPVRQYALERLDDVDETAPMRERHRAWYLALAERAMPELTRADQHVWYRRLAADYDNLRLALDSCRADPAGAEVELRLAAALGRYWIIHGPASEGQVWLEDALQRGPPVPSPARSIALNWAGVTAMHDGEMIAARERLEESVAVARAIGNPRLLAIALRHLTVAVHQQDPAAARALLEEALATARAADDTREVAYSLTFLGRIHELAGDLLTAERLYTEGLHAAQRPGDAQPLANALLNLGRMAAARNDYTRATMLLAESLGLVRELLFSGNAERGIALLHLVSIARAQGDSAAAFAQCLECLELALNSGDRLMMTAGLALMGGLEQAADCSAKAAQLFGAEAAARAHRGSLDVVRYPPPIEAAHYAADVAAARRALGDSAFTVEWSRGQRLTVEEATRLALADDPPLARAPHAPERATGLTPREQQVATLVGRGLTNRQIAESLVFGERTAEAHVAHCLAKLGLSSRTQLAAWTVARGLLEAPEPPVPA